MGKIFINPLSDGGFKRIFGIQGKSETYLIDFLNGLLGDDPAVGRIESVAYLNNEQPSESVYGKDLRYDLYCQTSTGHRFIVEMQRDVRPSFEQRAEYYVARAKASQLMSPEGACRSYSDLVPVVGVFILETRLPGKGDKVVLDYRYREKDDPENTVGSTRMLFVQLGCFGRKEEDCHTAVDQWLYILKNLDVMEYMPFREVRDRVFDRLDHYTRMTNLTESERNEYERLLKFQLDYTSDLQEARQDGLVKGRAEGEAKGRAEGEAKGRAEGIAEGLAEGMVQVARTMKSSGYPVVEISKMTGLSPQAIESL